MAIINYERAEVRGKIIKVGHWYSYRYLDYRQDPTPFCLFLGYQRGLNPRTGNLWNHLLCINFHYIPIPLRLKFYNKLYLPIMKKQKHGIRKLLSIIFSRSNRTRLITYGLTLGEETGSIRRYFPHRIRALKDLEDDVEQIEYKLKKDPFRVSMK